MLDVTFVTWLDEELERNGLTRQSLAAQGGFSHTALSHIYSGRRKPGIDICIAIARVLKLPPEVVLRAAELLPATYPSDPRAETLLIRILALPDNLRVQAEEYVDFLYHRKMGNDVAKEAPKSG